MEDAARALKMKPARLLEIEEDEYGNFPSLAYARGFVTSYGKYLKFDVKPYLKEFDFIDPLAKGDFPLKPATAAPNYRPFLRPGEKAQQKKPPIFALLMILIIVLAGAVGFNLYLAADRLGIFDPKRGKTANPENTQAENISKAPSQNASPLSPAPIVAPTTLPPETETPDASRLLPPATDPTPFHAAPETPSANVEPSSNSGILNADATGNSTLLMNPIGRTWVKVVINERTSDPIYQDWLNPGDAPLQMVGDRFFVEISDLSAVEVFRDGEAMPLSENQVVID